MGKSKGGAKSYRYGFGIHMGLSRGPINSIVQIKIGDKIAWTGNQQETGVINIDAKNLFGGDKQEGGVYGPLIVMMGHSDQTCPPSLQAMTKHPMPGFRGMVSAFFDGILSSNTPYPKSWKYRVRRSTQGWQTAGQMGANPWYPEKCMIELDADTKIDDDPGTDDYGPQKIHAMNPAHILYELFTNPVWGRGLPPAKLNVSSWVTAANTLFDEKFGLCIRWNRRDTLESFARLILSHVNGVIYTDRQTGLITFKLIRNDYVVEDLPLYDTNSGLLSVDEASVSALAPGVNEVRVTYIDPVDGDEHSVSAQNLASFQANGGRANPILQQYLGVPTAKLAILLAQRDLRANAIALRRFKLTMDRRAWRIPPGGVFRLRNPIRGIGDIVVRVGNIDDGNLINGRVKITAVQDIFAFPLSSFITPQPPKPIRPDTLPTLKRRRVFELPYALLNRYMTPADFAHIEDDNGYVGVVAEKPTELSAGYEFRTKIGASTPDETP